MAQTLDNGEFWLPSQFLTDDDILVDKENFDKNGANGDFGAEICFPTEFPYGFDSFSTFSALNSPVESVVSSTETESDEEDLLAGLTRQLARSNIHGAQKPATLEKTWGLSRSPHSTLSGIGRWSNPSQGTSPQTPLSPNNKAWDMIYAAAGQVARLKMGGDGPKFQNHHQQSRGLLRCPGNLSAAPVPSAKSAVLYSNQTLTNHMTQSNQYQNLRRDNLMKQQNCSIWEKQTMEGWFTQHSQAQQQSNQTRGRCVGFENGRCGRPLGLPQSAWPPLQPQQNHQQQQRPESGMRAVFLDGSGLRKESTGTGVFLPRRYGNPPDFRKKSGCSTVLLPARVVQALNLNFEDMNTHVPPRFGKSFASDYDSLVARKNALLGQQKLSMRPEGAVNHEIRLPQEWTY